MKCLTSFPARKMSLTTAGPAVFCGAEGKCKNEGRKSERNIIKRRGEKERMQGKKEEKRKKRDK